MSVQFNKTAANVVFEVLRSLWFAKRNVAEAKKVADTLEKVLLGECLIQTIENVFADKNIVKAIEIVLAEKRGETILVIARQVLNLPIEKIEQIEAGTYQVPERPSVRRQRTQAQNRSRQVEIAEACRPRFVHLWMNPRSPVAA